MAADLAADLEQAATAAVAAEELLGSDAFDPAGFAAGWAAGLGVIPESPAATGRRSGRRWLALAAGACFAIVAFVGAALAVLAFHGASVVAVVHGASTGAPHLHGFTRHVGPPAPGLRPFALTLLVLGLLGILGMRIADAKAPRGQNPALRAGLDGCRSRGPAIRPPTEAKISPGRPRNANITGRVDRPKEPTCRELGG